MPWDQRASARELRAVAPLVVDGKVIGPVTFVTTGEQTIGIASVEVLRRHESAGIEIGVTPDASQLVPMGNWSMGRYTGIGLVQLAVPIPAGADLEPLPIGHAYATLDTRGAPSALVTFAGGKRVVVPVHVDGIGGRGHESVAHLASPIDDPPPGAIVDGAPLFAWFAAEPALGREQETVVVGLGQLYRTQAFKPRDRPALVELIGLEDLGRALSWHSEERPDLAPATGEFTDRELPDRPPGVDDDDDP